MPQKSFLIHNNNNWYHLDTFVWRPVQIIKREDIFQYIKDQATITTLAGYDLENIKDILTDESFQKKIDNDNNIIAFTNGIYDISTNKFESYPMNKEHYITKSINHYYYHTKHSIDVNLYFEEYFQNSVINEYFLTNLASYLDSNEKKYIDIWCGSGSNGKTSVKKIIEQTFGNYCVNLSMTELLNLNVTHLNIYPLKGAKLVFVDYDHYSTIDSQKLLNVLNDDNCTFNIILLTNVNPKFSNTKELNGKVKYWEWTNTFNNPNHQMKQNPNDLIHYLISVEYPYYLKVKNLYTTQNSLKSKYLIENSENNTMEEMLKELPDNFFDNANDNNSTKNDPEDLFNEITKKSSETNTQNIFNNMMAKLSDPNAQNMLNELIKSISQDPSDNTNLINQVITEMPKIVDNPSNNFIEQINKMAKLIHQPNQMEYTNANKNIVAVKIETPRESTFTKIYNVFFSCLGPVKPRNFIEGSKKTL